MKLEHILSHLGQMEKAKFIGVLDTLVQDSDISPSYGQIKQASNKEIVALFEQVKHLYKDYLVEKFSHASPTLSLLTNVLSRDGNCVARVSWVESLYHKEHDNLEKKSKDILSSISKDGYEFNSYENRMRIYHSCLNEALAKGIRNNSDSKINNDERNILNILSKELDVCSEDKVVLEYILSPEKESNVTNYIAELRSLGLLFVKNKEQTIYVPDEMVTILNDIKDKILPDKYLIRILRTLSDAELSCILRNQNLKTRGVERVDKINGIVHLGLDIKKILSHYIFSDEALLNDKKERLKIMIDDLNIDVKKTGKTIESRIDIIVNSLNNIFSTESNILSLASFNDLLDKLNLFFEAKTGKCDLLSSSIRQQFEIEEQEKIDSNRLKSLSITPYDVLFILDNQDIKDISKECKISNRGNVRSNIIDSFNDATDKLIENYVSLANRNLIALHSKGLSLNEADIGLKFEEATRTILEEIGLSVDEDLRKSLNTSKNKIDLIISSGNDDIIVGEMKTCKGGEYNSYSAISRQTKSYVKLCEQADKNVTQVLIIAPGFSQDFIENAELDPDINISLLRAEGLYNIYKTYKEKRNPKFSIKWFQKGGLLKDNIIVKGI